MKRPANGETAGEHLVLGRGAGGALAVLLCCFCAVVVVLDAAADGVSPLELVAALFGDAPATDELDTNRDDRLSAPDLVALQFTPTPTATPTATPTPTPSPTPEGLVFAGSVADLIPHAVDDNLVYQVTSSSAPSATETARVIRSDAQGNFVVDEQGTSHKQQFYVVNETQFLYTGTTDIGRATQTTCTPPLVRLSTPLFAGQSLSTASRCRNFFNGLFVGTIELTETFTPIEVLDSFTVAAGTYSGVIHLSGLRSSSPGQPEADEIYLAPGIGVILQLETTGGQTTRRELIDGTVGGQSVRQ